jgi:hypothetical protein
MIKKQTVEKLKHTHSVFNNLFRKSRDNVKKCCRAGVTDDNITRHMRIACRIPRATNTNSEYVTPIAFPTATIIPPQCLVMPLLNMCLTDPSTAQP